MVIRYVFNRQIKEEKNLGSHSVSTTTYPICTKMPGTMDVQVEQLPDIDEAIPSFYSTHYYISEPTAYRTIYRLSIVDEI